MAGLVVDLDWCLACDSQLDTNFQCPKCPAAPFVKIIAPELSASTIENESDAGTIFHCIALVDNTTKPRREITNWLSHIPSSSPSTSSLLSSPASSYNARPSLALSRSDSTSTFRTSLSISTTISSTSVSEPALLARHRTKRCHPTLCMSAPKAEAVRPTSSSSSASSALSPPQPPPAAPSPAPRGLLAYLQQRSARRRAARAQSLAVVRESTITAPTTTTTTTTTTPSRKFDFKSRADAML